MRQNRPRDASMGLVASIPAAAEQADAETTLNLPVGDPDGELIVVRTEQCRDASLVRHRQRGRRQTLCKQGMQAGRSATRFCVGTPGTVVRRKGPARNAKSRDQGVRPVRSCLLARLRTKTACQVRSPPEHNRTGKARHYGAAPNWESAMTLYSERLAWACCVSLGVLASTSLAPAQQPSCDEWNTFEFFRDAAAATVSRCLEAGADIHARDDRLPASSAATPGWGVDRGAHGAVPGRRLYGTDSGEGVRRCASKGCRLVALQPASASERRGLWSVAKAPPVMRSRETRVYGLSGLACSHVCGPRRRVKCARLPSTTGQAKRDTMAQHQIGRVP